MRTVRRPLRWLYAVSAACLVLLGSASAAAAAASNPLALPAASVPKGLHIVPAGSRTIDIAAVRAMADTLTADTFKNNSLTSGYEQRLEGTAKGARVVLTAFAFKTDTNAGLSRGVWTWETPGDLTVLDNLPKSAQVFEHKVSGPGPAGWQVQVVFRKGRVLVNVDARYPGTAQPSQGTARLMAAQVTQAYSTWLSAKAL